MALHSHLVTANMTRAVSDGRWLSLANPKHQSPLLREARHALTPGAGGTRKTP
jgi:hypothetical protein